MREFKHDRQTLDVAFARERPRIVGLCVHLSGDSSAGEDLAQETLVEAWRNIHKLRRLDGLGPWLSAIARNVCLRARRRRGRQARWQTRVTDASMFTDHDMVSTMVEDDLELELERADLADLLDRSLALLPPATRAIFLDRYAAERSLAEIAARFGISTGAVKMRLQRGKHAVRRALTEDLRLEAAA